MQAANEGDNDRREAVAGRDHRLQQADRPGDFADAGKTGHAAADQQRQPDVALLAEAGVVRRRRCQPGDLHAIASVSLGGEQPGQQGQHQRHDQRAGHPRAFDQCRQDRGFGKRPGLRKVVAGRVLPRPVHQIAEQLLSDVDQHQADQDFVGVKAGAQEGRDRRPGHAADGTGQHHQRQGQRAQRITAEQGHGAAGNRADDQLTFGPDVPDIGLEADRQPERAEHQRRGLQLQFADLVAAAEWCQKEHLERGQRVLTEDQEHDQAGDRHRRRRDQRRGEAHRR